MNLPSARVARWSKYGHDRLYVTAADGARLGWRDLKTGEDHLDVPHRRDEFYSALTASGQHSPASPDRELPAPPQPAGADLTANRPGQGARSQAVQHGDALKSRSRLLSAAARLLDVKTDERAWRKGAEGEEAIGARLERLTSHGWHVLHSVPIGTRGADIDHILIGPGGVYTINTKNHPGKRIWISPNQIRVNGQPVPYLRNSRYEADRVHRILTSALGWEVAVRPVLVLLTGTLLPQIDIKSGGPTDVLVLDRMDVPGAFRRAPQRLQRTQIEETFEVARRSSTWRH